MQRKVKISELKPGDKIIYYIVDSSSTISEVLKGKVRNVWKEFSNADIHTATIKLEDDSVIHIDDTDYFDLIVSNDLQQRKRSEMNNVPSHYQGKDGVDVIEFCRQQFTHEELVGALKMNIIKYATRIGRKNQDVEDVEKIGVYQRRLSEVLENE
ncbi:DUF3310 domain-containing protein [uncultured Staphylococcus sp.]|uniref:DUF3310 domain-containing protein n=1 Tax=uncultured Staphylococcus sp. TaxID=189668 RepID=UPI0025D0A2D9|nr:DUF3310 domain-containing protein [uncultured Staphylococcus sp.]